MKIFKLLDMRYHTFVDATRKYVSQALSDFGTNYGNNTVFGQLINVLSDTVQTVMLYIEDALLEQNKYTAQRKKSLLGLAQLTGYNPSFGKAATAQVTLSYIPKNVSSVDVVIKNKDQITCTQNGLIYSIIMPQEAVVISVERDNSVKQFTIVEGKFETQSFVARGGNLYTQNITFNGSIDTDYLEVKVNNELWKPQASLYDMNPMANQYTFKPGMDGKLNLIFGNNVHGKALEAGDYVEVSYLIHSGEFGNIDLTKGVEFSFNSPIYSINGDSINGDAMFKVRLSNNDSVSSGTNSESAEEIRQNIGLNSRSLVLASPENYKNFLSKFSFCGYNRTWSEPGSLVVNSIIMKNYKSYMKEGKDYFSLTKNDFILSDLQKSSIVACLNNSGQQLAGITYNVFDPEICRYAATIYVTLKNKTYDTSYIKNQIMNLVGDFFCNVENDMFIPKSDIIKLIKNNIPNIDSVDVYFISERNEVAMMTGKYVSHNRIYNPSTNSYTDKPETVVLYHGENPNIGLDNHGNIVLDSVGQFPVLMSGWSYKTTAEQNGTTSSQEVEVNDALTIIFE